MSLEVFLDRWLGQMPAAYLAAHDGQVPSLEVVIADVKAQRPVRDSMLVFIAAGVRDELSYWQTEQAMSAADKYATAEFNLLIDRLERSQWRNVLCGMLDGALDAAEKLEAKVRQKPQLCPPAESAL